MARYLGPVCKQCRREGAKLFLKGERCLSDKCAFDRRPYAPGQHGQRRSKASEYSRHLREKQKVRRIYGILEKQFSLYFDKADAAKGVTGDNLLRLLESRLDNIVYRMGFANTRKAGRQLVRHNHVLINGKKVNIPSYLVKAGDEISIRERSLKIGVIQGALESKERTGWDPWLEVDAKKFKGVVKEIPQVQDLQLSIEPQLIVEFYSK
ncbi:MAG: 30S ribosomal protein S4 [Proteobacteria bacterium]|nr:30S ribosomal protein S4 [Pseudomonadota bacterium]NLN61645.1 30S ribosomal protein S4 [Myxococcales bacterium]